MGLFSFLIYSLKGVSTVMSFSILLSQSVRASLHCLARVSAVLVAVLVFCNIALAVDINTADEKALQEIKGIGPAKAKAIIEERNKNGPFKSLDQVSERVKGIGPSTVAQWKKDGKTTVGGGSPSAGGSASTDKGGKKSEAKDEPKKSEPKGDAKKSESKGEAKPNKADGKEAKDSKSTEKSAK